MYPLLLLLLLLYTNNPLAKPADPASIEFSYAEEIPFNLPTNRELFNNKETLQSTFPASDVSICATPMASFTRSCVSGARKPPSISTPIIHPDGTITR